MTTTGPSTRKVAISVPADLLAFADDQARREGTSRSAYISRMLARLKAELEQRLAAEGYRFYAEESAAFAAASAAASAEAVAEGWGDER
jgi:metal-responsive CopG/Arc/MetJ family transcriptional regulator